MRSASTETRRVRPRLRTPARSERPRRPSDAASAPGNDAGRPDGEITPPFCPTLMTCRRHTRRQWDFTPERGPTASNGWTSAAYRLRADETKRSRHRPPPLHSRIPASRLKSRARRSVRHRDGPVDARPLSHRALALDCPGGRGDGGDHAPPSVLELYCVTTRSPDRSFASIARAASSTIDRGREPRDVEDEELPVAVSPTGWHHLQHRRVAVRPDRRSGSHRRRGRTTLATGEMLPGAPRRARSCSSSSACRTRKSSDACALRRPVLEWPTPLTRSAGRPSSFACALDDSGPRYTVNQRFTIDSKASRGILRPLRLDPARDPRAAGARRGVNTTRDPVRHADRMKKHMPVLRTADRDDREGRAQYARASSDLIASTKKRRGSKRYRKMVEDQYDHLEALSRAHQRRRVMETSHERPYARRPASRSRARPVRIERILNAPARPRGARVHGREADRAVVGRGNRLVIERFEPRARRPLALRRATPEHRRLRFRGSLSRGHATTRIVRSFEWDSLAGARADRAHGLHRPRRPTHEDRHRPCPYHTRRPSATAWWITGWRAASTRATRRSTRSSQRPPRSPHLDLAAARRRRRRGGMRERRVISPGR